MVSIDQSKCIGCGKCVNDCVAGNLKLKDGKAECGGPCILCGHCAAICPSEAVSMPECDMPDVEAYDKGRFGLDIDKLIYTVKLRRSIRQYTGQPVEREKLERIVQAGRYTATGGNRQACRFIVVQDGLSALKEKIWNGVDTAAENTGELSSDMMVSLKRFSDMRANGIDYLFRNAPVVIYIAAESAVDAALAAQNMELAAIAQGMGVLYNGFLVYAANMNPNVREWLGARDKPMAVCMLAGYPQVTYKRSAPRKPADVRWL